MTVEPSLYTILGVDPRATTEDIRRAFRHLARSVHPDASVGSDADTARFREIRRAYEILSDPSSRRRYDDSLRSSPGGRRIEVRTASTSRSGPGRPTGDVCLTCGDARKVAIMDTCPSCDSSGTIVELGLHRAVRRLCPTCAGRARVRRVVACPTCAGSTDPR